MIKKAYIGRYSLGVVARRISHSGLVIGATLLMMGCSQEPGERPAQIRPVQVASVERRNDGQSSTFTGQIQAQNEVSLAFRVSGRMIERPVNVGDKIIAGQVVARLDSQNAQNTLRSARAALAAAESQLITAQNAFSRQDRLLRNGFTTRAHHDDARSALETARSSVDNAQAQVKIAEDNLGYTELIADSSGIVTERGAEPGEVVQAGQMVVEVAREGGRDGVFEVPAGILREAEPDSIVNVTLTSDPSVKAVGRVREVSPRADPVTRTFQVRVGIDNAPDAMRLGATVNGRVSVGSASTIKIPASALTAANDAPAVWIVDPQTETVTLRNIEVAGFGSASVSVASGLSAGDIIVTAGIQALHPGQKVRVLGLSES
ncbi:efflux RND transporter periplasmic adaptor subunit [Brucella intermedia]|uniref:efflux RND transporter periplasmic adaptor subunit n=1 Tax=Brucella intermedia TaxID=94625 RepID=UPI00200015DE|nr:efflux RND transporter periplasmic adaptor subunit [Brucella intermedia]